MSLSHGPAVRVAIDAMGGDHGLSVTIPAAIDFLQRHERHTVLLVGHVTPMQAAFEQALQTAKCSAAAADGLRARVAWLQADEVVAMDDPPAVALKNKRQSSMRLAIAAVADGQAQAAVSAGNTGALMAISRFVLKMIDGIDRPAIATSLPNRTGGSTLMLDLGANVDCSADHLLQFAMMGSALVAALDGPARPSIGLLNVGEEVIKGNEVVKQAGELLRASSLNFLGNVEGNDIFKGTAEVIVCDGFVGNVALKTSEGLAQMMGGFLKDEFKRNGLTMLAAMVAKPILRRFARRADHRRYNGAALLGLRGIVFKSHGSADAYAFRHAIERAAEAASHGLNERIRAALVAG
ncbi:MAG: phosphate acyltransferase PlsX [Betaproteobacteria bacterium]|nr:phosphate acyltransferase PlsX [Betaproteobacteria bacterium]